MSDENDKLIAPAPEEENETMDMEMDMEAEMMDMMEMSEEDMQDHMMEEAMESPFSMLMKIEKLMQWSMIDPTMGQISYMLIAGSACAHYSLQAFRYFGDEKYYATYTLDKSSGTQWFELGNKMINFTNLAVYGVAFITSLLALFGIAPGINYMVWFWGVMVLGGGANMIGELFYFIGQDGAYSDYSSTATDAKSIAKVAIGGAVYVAIRSAMVEQSVIQTMINFSLYANAENWMWAMFNAMPQEEKDAKVEELMMQVEEWEKEMMAEMEAEMEEDMEAEMSGDDAEESADDAEEAAEDAEESAEDAEEADEDAEEAEDNAEEAAEDAEEADEEEGFGGEDPFDEGFGDEESFDGGFDDDFEDIFN